MDASADGMPRCLLCGGVINAGEVPVVFPPGVFRPRDPFFNLDNSTVHLNCLQRQSFGSTALNRLNSCKQRAFDRESTGPDEDELAVTMTPIGRVGMGALLLALVVGVGVVWGRKAWSEGTTTVHIVAIGAYLITLVIGVRSGLSSFREILVMSMAPQDAVARLKRSRQRNRRWAWPSTMFGVAVVSGQLAGNAWANLSVSLIGAFCSPIILLMMAAWLARNRKQTQAIEEASR